MPTTTRCARPGCTGTILDGYCDTCGMAPAPARPTPASTAPTSRPRVAGGSAPTGPVSRPGTSASMPMSSPAGTRSSARTGSRRTSSSHRSRAGSGRLGAGIVNVPPMPVLDPSKVVMAKAEVAEDKRFCGKCGTPVGRGRGGHPGRGEGFCPKCGQRFSFTPKLKKGDVVGNQYEVVGALAHGGLGWIYLARDRNVSGRWVVLKGLLDAGDKDAVEAALAERRFLAEVEHPSIVKIYNFVEHLGAGYTVMEHVGGTSLKDLLKQRRAAKGDADPLPPSQAIAFLLEVLPALGYLHRQGLLYCDFKPDNVIQSGDAIKLIDLGGVRRIDDDVSAVYGTVGYQAPEIAEVGPSISSDLYTVARALAVLILDFRGYTSTFQFDLPGPADAPVFARHESLHRFLLKGTARNPDDRFQSAEEMSDQLLGVLRQVVALDDGVPHPAVSTVFASERARGADGVDWRDLPKVLPDPNDPQAAFLASVTVAEPAELLTALEAAPGDSPEVLLRRAGARIALGESRANDLLDLVERGDAWDWRVSWYRGIAALAGGDAEAARVQFDLTWSDLPGELVPQLALAMADEAAADHGGAAPLYDAVVRSDPSFTAAAFGLARCRTAAGDRKGAVLALAGIPDTSAAWQQGQVAAAGVLIATAGSVTPAVDDLVAAARTVESLQLDAVQRASLSRDVLGAALDLLEEGKVAPDPARTLLGQPLEERSLRRGLERVFLNLARLAPTPAERDRLVDQSNKVRPRTLL